MNKKCHFWTKLTLNGVIGRKGKILKKILVGQKKWNLKCKLSHWTEIDLVLIIKCIRIVGYDCLKVLKLHQAVISPDAVKSITGLFDTKKYSIRTFELMDCQIVSPDLVQCLLYRIGFTKRTISYKTLRDSSFSRSPLT